MMIALTKPAQGPEEPGEEKEPMEPKERKKRKEQNEPKESKDWRNPEAAKPTRAGFAIQRIGPPSEGIIGLATPGPGSRW